MNTFASGLREIPKDLAKTKTALELFRSGFDTADIAHAKCVHEAVVLNWITRARFYHREARLGG